MQNKRAWPFHIHNDSAHSCLIQVKHQNESQEVSPEECTSILFKHLKKSVEAYIHQKSISKVVIAIPARFNQDQQEAVLDAAAKAELQVMELITGNYTLKTFLKKLKLQNQKQQHMLMVLTIVLTMTKIY